MRWPPWSPELRLPGGNNDDSRDHNHHQQRSAFTTTITNALNSLTWSSFTSPQTLIPTAILTSAILSAARFHRRYLRRFPDATSIPTAYFRRRSIFGKVTSVGDGDNFRVFHTPGGRLAGWGWMPWKRVPRGKKELRDNTVRTRLSLSLFSDRAGGGYTLRFDGLVMANDWL
jgi:hypothetical protein